MKLVDWFRKEWWFLSLGARSNKEQDEDGYYSFFHERFLLSRIVCWLEGGRVIGFSNVDIWEEIWFRNKVCVFFLQHQRSFGLLVKIAEFGGLSSVMFLQYLLKRHNGNNISTMNKN